MATALTRPVIRKVQVGRELLNVRITANGVEVREHGRRSWYPQISWSRIHTQSAELAAAAHRRPRRASRGRIAVGI